jgi:hypothetical protein
MRPETFLCLLTNQAVATSQLVGDAGFYYVERQLADITATDS